MRGAAVHLPEGIRMRRKGCKVAIPAIDSCGAHRLYDCLRGVLVLIARLELL